MDLRFGYFYYLYCSLFCFVILILSLFILFTHPFSYSLCSPFVPPPFFLSSLSLFPSFTLLIYFPFPLFISFFCLSFLIFYLSFLLASTNIFPKHVPMILFCSNISYKAFYLRSSNTFPSPFCSPIQIYSSSIYFSSFFFQYFLPFYSLILTIILGLSNLFSNFSSFCSSNSLLFTISKSGIPFSFFHAVFSLQHPFFQKSFSLLFSIQIFYLSTSLF